jgi:transposase
MTNQGERAHHVVVGQRQQPDEEACCAGIVAVATDDGALFVGEAEQSQNVTALDRERRLRRARGEAGKKRHVLVDTIGLLLHAVVHPADIQDRDGGVLVLSTLFGMYPFLLKLFADAGYQGPKFQAAATKLIPQLSIEIVKRSNQAKGFVVLPRRWVVERTLAWLGRCRRLAKDFENLTRMALAFVRLASIRLMLRRLCNP